MDKVGWLPLYADVQIDTSLVTNAAYQVFLDEQRTRGKYLQPDHWNAFTFPKGQEQTAVLGVRYADATAFCDWLNERETGVWRYRLPTEDDLKRGQYNVIFPAVDAEKGYWTKEGKIRIQKEPFTLDSVCQYVKGTFAGDRSMATGIEEGRNVDYDFEEETAYKFNLHFRSIVWSAAEFPYSWLNSDPFVINGLVHCG